MNALLLNMRNCLSTLLFLLLLLGVSCSSDNDTKSNFRTVLDDELETIITDYGLVGISATIILPNGQMWNGYAGDSFEGSEINRDHLFGAASVTKAFVATIIMQLVEEGILDLDDTLDDLLNLNEENVSGSITVRQLLSHTSGIYNYNEHPNIINVILSDPLNIWEPHEVFAFVEEPYFDPGTGWYYSNTNFIILGMIIEEITGRTVGAELHSRIIDPLKLNNTLFPLEDDLGSSAAHPWTMFINNTLMDGAALPTDGLYSAAWSAGALFSTSHDLAEFTRQLFTANLVSVSSLQLMTSFVDVGNSSAVDFQGYGLGLMQFEGDLEYWGHNGLILGYGSLIAYFPDEELIITFLVNKEIPGEYDDILDDLLDAVLLEID